MKRFFLANVQEQRSSRRWKYIWRFAWLLLLVGFLIAFLGTILSLSSLDDRINQDMQHTHVAIIDIKGPIVEGGYTGAEFIIDALHDAFNNAAAKAIILNINSPGGSPVQSSLIYDEIKLLKSTNSTKKIYAVIGDVGASAAYHIASATDEIFANRNSIVGSIGVIMVQFDYQELFKKIGLKHRLKKSGLYKDIGNPGRDETAFERRFFEQTFVKAA